MSEGEGEVPDYDDTWFRGLSNHIDVVLLMVEEPIRSTILTNEAMVLGFSVGFATYLYVPTRH